MSRALLLQALLTGWDDDVYSGDMELSSMDKAMWSSGVHEGRYPMYIVHVNVVVT